MSVDLSIICVNWNSVDYLLECIPSIYAWTQNVAFEVIVVDNASPTRDLDRLQQRLPEIKIVKCSTNLGFAAANNVGVRHSGGDWLLFLNPDTKLLSPAVNTMLDHARELPRVGVVGCTLLNADLSVQTSSIMRFPRILNSVLQVESLRLRWPKLWGIGPLFSGSDNAAVVEAISGACMLIRREVFEQVGMFSEDYFMYSEDVDLCYQCVQAGLNNYYIRQGMIVHYGGKSSAPNSQTATKAAAELRFCKKNYGQIYAALYRIAMTINAAARLCMISIQSLLPTASRTRDGSSADTKIAKWIAILKTSLGLPDIEHNRRRPMAEVSCQQFRA